MNKLLVFSQYGCYSLKNPLLCLADVNTERSASQTCNTGAADIQIEIHLVATAEPRDNDLPRVRMISARSSGSHTEVLKLKKMHNTLGLRDDGVMAGLRDVLAAGQHEDVCEAGEKNIFGCRREAKARARTFRPAESGTKPDGDRGSRSAKPSV
jgi:hypothetical protein